MKVRLILKTKDDKGNDVGIEFVAASVSYANAHVVQMLWNAERAINEFGKVRCHILEEEAEEDNADDI